MSQFLLPCVTCVSPPSRSRRLGGILLGVLAFGVVELAVGWYSQSLSLRADAAHMGLDGGAIAIALLATRFAHWPPTAPYSHRLERIATVINGGGLLLMALWVGQEAIAHLQGMPAEILSLPMVITAVLGLFINGFNLFWLHNGWQQDLNLRGVFWHLLADLLGSIGAVAAALAVTFLRWTWADTVIGGAIASFIAIVALNLLWQVGKTWHPPASPSPEATLEALGWLEVGHADLSRLVTK